MENTMLLHDILSASSLDYKNVVAARCGENCITYGELEHRSNQLCYSMITSGVRYRDRVVIYLDKSIESLVAIFGILKAGATYVPLDTATPVSRAVNIISDCTPSAIVSSFSKINKINAALSGLRVFVFDKDNEEELLLDSVECLVRYSQIMKCSVVNKLSRVIENDPAYILYTSGSTGKPKGVVITHRAAIVFINWSYVEFQVLPGDVISNHAPLHFDLSIFDVFVTIKAGGTIILIPTTVSFFPRDLIALIMQEKINVWYSVPSVLMKMMMYGDVEILKSSSLRLILFAGEVFPVKYLKQLMSLLPNVIFYNLYGPTETNVCTYYQVTSNFCGNAIPIGSSCPYNRLFLLNNDSARYINSDSSENMNGELCVQGSNVMLCYWGDVDATKFRKRKINVGDVSEVVYCTGDLVEVGTNGDITYLGRIDGMIKSRGYRIELEEIESVLYSHPDINRVAAVAIPDLENTNLIQVIIAPRNENNNTLSKSAVRSFCNKRLPKYMVPAFVDFCQELPETSTGKVDKVRLREIFIKKREKL